MAEVWLRNNTRVFTLAMIAPALGGLIALNLAIALGRWGHTWLAAIFWVLVGMALICIAALVWQLRRPRLAYSDGRLAIFLRWGGPVRVPIEQVEGFLLGQGPTLLTKHGRREMETATVVIKMSERAPELERVDVDRMLGNWCGHYVTIRGTFCEPINLALVNRLNARLHEATTAVRQAAR